MFELIAIKITILWKLVVSFHAEFPMNANEISKTNELKSNVGLD